MSPTSQLDIFEAAEILWRRRWLFLVIVFGFGLAAAAYAFLAKPWYRAAVVVVKSESDALPMGLSRLSGLAGLAGIEIGAGSESQEPLAILRSRDFARQFIEDKDLLPVLFAKEWDPVAGRWKSAEAARHPDIRDGVKYFDEVVRSVYEDKKTGLVTLSVTWTDPATSAQWANELIVRANKRMQSQALEESERNVAFLKAQLLSTGVTALQTSIGEVLEREMQRLLLARGNEEYAFKVVDSAFPPKRKSKPRRVLIVGAAMLLGGLFAAAVIFTSNAVESRRRSKALDRTGLV